MSPVLQPNAGQEITFKIGNLSLFYNDKISIQVGVRYISEYEKKDLKDCIKFNFSFGLPQVQSETTAFRSEFNTFNYSCFVNPLARFNTL
jgi:hypothetical protein